MLKAFLFGVDLQFQQGKVRIAIVCLVLALLSNIVLENIGGLGIVSVEAIQYLIDVFGPVRRKVECDAHGCRAKLSSGKVLRCGLSDGVCR